MSNARGTAIQADDIMTGKADGPKMFMEGKYQVEGDLSLMMELTQAGLPVPMLPKKI